MPRSTKKRAAVLIRVSFEEKARFEAAAAADHLPIGTWLRWLGIREAASIPRKQSLFKLRALKVAGLISEQEYQRRRSSLRPQQ